MSPEDFNKWIEQMKLNKAKAASLLGLSGNTVDKYSEMGAPDHIGYACSAIASGLLSKSPIRKFIKLSNILRFCVSACGLKR